MDKRRYVHEKREIMQGGAVMSQSVQNHSDRRVGVAGHFGKTTCPRKSGKLCREGLG